ncbi:MAG TPA: hypothetical protein VNM66_09270 [Thermodesulfobacteriota bacterium]|nr:hypothetical protein [Thermodesulfobacteriota bacterium]
MGSGPRVVLPVELEILREKAASLGRVGERLEASLARLAELGRRFAAAREETERAWLAERYREEWARAARLRYYLIVQREAIGFRRHADVDRVYPLPPPRPEPAGDD